MGSLALHLQVRQDFDQPNYVADEISCGLKKCGSAKGNLIACLWVSEKHNILVFKMTVAREKAREKPSSRMIIRGK